MKKVIQMAGYPCHCIIGVIYFRAASAVDEETSCQAAMFGMDFLHTALKQDLGTHGELNMATSCSFRLY